MANEELKPASTVPPIFVVPDPENVRLTAATLGCPVVIPLLILSAKPELTLMAIPLIPLLIVILLIVIVPDKVTDALFVLITTRSVVPELPGYTDAVEPPTDQFAAVVHEPDAPPFQV
jgi:hypothetical protein